MGIIHTGNNAYLACQVGYMIDAEGRLGSEVLTDPRQNISELIIPAHDEQQSLAAENGLTELLTSPFYTANTE